MMSESNKELVNLVWGEKNGKGLVDSIFSRWTQGFGFSDSEPTALEQFEGGPCAVIAPVQREKLEEEVVDDKATDQTWTGVMSSEESSVDVEASAAPKRVIRGRGQLLHRSQARASKAQDVPCPSHSRKTLPSRPRSSVVWRFFNVCAEDKLSAICTLCNAKLSRGSLKSNMTTTAMRRHLEGKHWAHWETANAGQSSSGVAATASSTVSSAGAAVQTSSQDTSTSASATLGTSPSSSPFPASAPSPAPSCASSQQLSINQALNRRQKYSARHSHAQALDGHISKLLALEMLPFRLVETQAFRDLMAAAAPRYVVPSRHYFSQCAVPALHQHVSHNIRRALSSALCTKVHLTTDAWTSACGQGHYISLTAHWVNVVEAGTESQTGVAYLLSPPKIPGRSSEPPSSSSAVTSTRAASWKRCSTGVGRRQQAVLKLIRLGNRKHTASELRDAILDETAIWFEPLHLVPGMVVCDNGWNLVAALELARLKHVPCLAHVFNLVVHRFLKTYPNVPELLAKVRRLCAHFRKSTVAAASLKTLQQRLHMPEHRLLCDVPTRWNSTYHMLSRVCEQQRPLMEYQLQNPRVPHSQLPQFLHHEWPWMADLCEILRVFEESTKRVSCDDALVSVTIPLLCVMRESLIAIRDNALYAEESGTGADSSQLDTQSTHLSASQCGMTEEEEEEDDEVADDVILTHEASGEVQCIPLLQRGWGEGEEEMESDPSGGGGKFMPINTLAHMADFMLGCFSSDKRIVQILESNQYWIFAILDPRYKNNISSFIPVEGRANRMSDCYKQLVQNMMEMFPSTLAGSTQESSSKRLTTATRSTPTRGTLSKVWDTLMAPPRQPTATEGPSDTRREKYGRMLREYLADDSPVLSDPSAPYTYWVSKLDVWLELALYALEILSCPAASVLSERVFTAVGGIITDKRSRLSAESADLLTLIKMNSHWIDPGFASPPVSSTPT
ncbi:ubiquitin carboxyl-terminal hydrolase MINDY-3 isoform 1-T1 [Leptodactylus fuscus]|uniref:ubiquitin carboxyl-terminal hydrolase MINDY-3 isoform X1 n=1 Tax=Leptodactylus fuscus TaxID=238119 RepID=UPI003F4EC928